MRLRLVGMALVLVSVTTTDALRLSNVDQAELLSQTATEAEDCMKDMCCCGGFQGYRQMAPSINAVDNSRVMIPEGANPYAVKMIVGEIMKNGIGGIKGAMEIIKELGGKQGYAGLNIPGAYK